MKTPVLITERLLLRHFYTEDATDVFYGWESDPEVSKYMFWKSHNDINKTIQWVEDEVSKIDSDTWYRWAIISKEDGKLLGTCLIYFNEEYGEYEVAYNLSKNAWGKGYVTEAMRDVIKFAKNELGINKVMGRCVKENLSSRKVMKNLGFNFNRYIPYECNMGENTYDGEEYILSL